MQKWTHLLIKLTVAFALLAAPFQPALAQSAAGLRLQAVALREQPDSLLLGVYFALFDSQTQQVIPYVKVKNAEISFLNTGETYPMTVGTPDTPIYIALVLDSSGSMAGAAAKMREAASAALNNAPSGARFSVFTFNENIQQLQDYTENIYSVKNAIDHVEPQAYKGTCLYDAAFTALQTLEPAPIGRRALILFTDGKDETMEGQACSQHTYKDVVDYAVSSDMMTPVNIIGLSGKESKINEVEITQMALTTSGFYAIGGDENLSGLFDQIMLALKSQWMAVVNYCAHQGVQDAELKVTLENGEQLSSRFSFESRKEYNCPGPVSVRVGSLKYLSESNKYGLTLKFTGMDVIAGVKIDIWDRSSGVSVKEYTYNQPAAEQGYELDAADLAAGHEYDMRISLLGADGSTFEIPGENNATAEYLVHPFKYDPSVATGATLRITSVSIPGDMVMQVVVDNPERVSRYEAWLMNEETRLQMPDSVLSLKTLPQDGKISISTSKLPQGKYAIVFRALGPNNEELASTSYEGINFTPVLTPEDTFDFSDVLDIVKSNPMIVIAIVGIIVLVVAWLIISSLREKWATGTPMLGGSGRRKNNALPINDLDLTEKSAPSASTPAAAAPAPAPVPTPQPAKPARQDQTMHEAFGASQGESIGARLTIFSKVDGVQNGKTILLTGETLTIGRQGTNIIIEDPSISRTHLRIELDSATGAYRATDLNSRNGVRLNGMVIPPETPQLIKPGTWIEISSNTKILYEI